MSTIRRTAAFTFAATTAGVSTLALGVTAAQAEPMDVTCDAGGTLVATDICEVVFTATPGSPFEQTSQMGALEVLPRTS